MDLHELDTIIYSANLARIEALCSQSSQSFSSIARTRLHLEKFELEHVEEALAEVSDADEKIYLNIAAQLAKGKMAEGFHDELKGLAQKSFRYEIFYATYLYSKDCFRAAQDVLRSLSDNELTPPFRVLKLHVLSLIAFQTENMRPANECMRLAKEQVQYNGLWLLKPSIDYLKIKSLLSEKKVDQALAYAEFVQDFYTSPIFKKSLLPTRRLVLAIQESQQIDFQQRPQMRTLFDAFYIRRELSKADIAETLYQEEYNPIIHDSRVYMAVRRLKSSIREQHKTLVRCANGWRLTSMTRESETHEI